MVNTITLREKQLSNLVREVVVKTLNENKKKRVIKENFDMLTTLAGVLGVGAVSYGVAEALEALEQGKLGESGLKLAKFLNDIGRAANGDA